MKRFNLVVLGVLALFGLSLWIIEFYYVAEVGDTLGFTQKASLVPTFESPETRLYLLTLDHDTFDAPTPGNLLSGDDSFLVVSQDVVTRRILNKTALVPKLDLDPQSVLTALVANTGSDNAIEPYEPLFPRLALATLSQDKNSLILMPLYDAGIRSVFINDPIITQVKQGQWDALASTVGYVVRADGSKRQIKLIGVPTPSLAGFL